MCSPITSVAECRDAYDAYLQYMLQHPWQSGRVWDETVSHMRKVCECVRCDPPNMRAVGRLGFAMEKGAGGSREMLYACPDAEISARKREASDWLHFYMKGELTEGEPLPPNERAAWLRQAETHRLRYIEQLKQPPKRHYTIDNSPEGWAKFERDFKLKPGTMARLKRKSGGPTPILVPREDKHGITRLVVYRPSLLRRTSRGIRSLVDRVIGR